MQRPIFGHSFAVLVAPILLSVLAFKFLNKKKTNARRNAEDADPSASGSMTLLKESESGGSSSSLTGTSDGATIEKNYEVFLSFRGSDTRNYFTDHLYHGLRNAGIRTFRDDEELRQGEEIRPDLLAAIKNSQILIPILSVNYGESKWCLEELVQIMECKKNKTGHIVLPVFYKVAPADVRHQKGSFGKAFKKRERRERRRGSDSTILEKWKEALREVGDSKGREAKGSEAELVKSVVQQVLLELKNKFELVIPENLVGIDSHVKTVMKFVDSNSRATLFVGIHGMGGIGKTTLAKTIYNKLSSQFDHHSFIADVRESCKGKGVHHLQNQLIFDILKQKDQVHTTDEGIKFLSSKLGGEKVLILFDDVDDDKQLKALAGNHNWFSSGSVIIVTTRDESILDKENVDYKYEHKDLDEDNSSILFSRHAFRKDAPPSEFKEMTDEVLHTTGGLPLSLEVLGSFLCGKDQTVWRGTIKKLRKFPHEDVQNKLRISYEALTRTQKQIFLDIACFFIGSNKIIVSYMWDACDYFPEEGIEVLRLRSLIKVGGDQQLIMHDQLRDLGRAIVCEENEMEPGKRSRLWDSEEALKMLEENEGTRNVEAIHLGKYSSSFRQSARETTNQDGYVLTGEQFKELKNLRFLEASGAHFSGDFNNSFKKLKWLQWQHCPSAFEASNFRTKELAVLDLANSEISDKWQGWSFIMMAKELKFLNLTGCESLEKTSFLSAFEKLEVLILEDCENIKQIDSSIGEMKSLVCLDLSGCYSLEGLPVEVGKLEALEHLLLRHSGIRQLPDSIGDLQNLEALDISGTKIEKLPNDIGRLRQLRELQAWSCEALRETPESIRNLSSLQRLDLGDCDELQSLPVLPSSLKSLRVTCGSRRSAALPNRTHLECTGEPPSIPSKESLNTPSELEILEIDICFLLEILDVSQSNHLKKLSVNDSDNIHEIRGLDKLKYLKRLVISSCSNLVEIRDLVASEEIRISFCCSIERLDLTNCEGLERLDISQCDSIKMLELPKFQRLKSLTVHFCKNLVEIRDLVALEEMCISYCHLIKRLDLTNCEGLERLDISCCASIKMLELPKSQHLKRLTVRFCDNLVDIQDLVTLEKISISDCHSIERLDLTNCEGLKILHVEFFIGRSLWKRCASLVEIQGLNGKVALEEMRISGCHSIEKLDLTKSESLKILNVKGCKNLVEIQGLNRKMALEKIRISTCRSIEKLDLTKSESLKILDANGCKNLVEIQGLNTKTALEEIRIIGCRSIKKLDLTKSEGLKELHVGSCENLSEIQGFHKLEYLKLPEKSTSLKNMYILGCSSIEILPDLSSCTNLVRLVVQDCEKLTELRGLEKLEGLEKVDISGCKSLKTIPELSRANIYQNYELTRRKSDDAMIVLEQDDRDEDEVEVEVEDEDEDEDEDHRKMKMKMIKMRWELDDTMTALGQDDEDEDEDEE